MSTMAPRHLVPFGDREPWSEPSWYSALDSPYYNDSHRALRKFVREYIDENVLPFSEEWERQGHVPKEVGSMPRSQCT